MICCLKQTHQPVNVAMALTALYTKDINDDIDGVYLEYDLRTATSHNDDITVRTSDICWNSVDQLKQLERDKNDIYRYVESEIITKVKGWPLVSRVSSL